MKSAIFYIIIIFLALVIGTALVHANEELKNINKDEKSQMQYDGIQRQISELERIFQERAVRQERIRTFIPKK